MTLDVNLLLIFVPIVLIQIILLIVALIDCLKREKLNGPKWLWVVIILLVNLLGPILYFTVGRKVDE